VGLLSNRDLPWLGGFEDQGVEAFMTPIERLVTGPPDITIEEAERRMFSVASRSCRSSMESAASEA